MLLLKKIIRSFSGLRINIEEPLQGPYLDWVLVSSMYAAQQSAYLNSNITGISKKEIKHMLENYWGIYNKNQAIVTLNRLLKSNHDTNIQTVYNAYKNREHYVAILKEGLPQDEDSFEFYLNQYRTLVKVVPQLIEDGVFNDFSEINTIKDSGWNYGRCAYLARCCFELGYISKTKMLQFLEISHTDLKQHCSTWKEYTKSYIFGRALWGGPYNDGMQSIAKNLLSNNKSPLKHKKFI